MITHWEKLLGYDSLSDCEFIRKLKANSVIQANYKSQGQKSIIHSECKYENELTIDDQRLTINDKERSLTINDHRLSIDEYRLPIISDY